MVPRPSQPARQWLWVALIAAVFAAIFGMGLRSGANVAVPVVLATLFCAFFVAITCAAGLKPRDYVVAAVFGALVFIAALNGQMPSVEDGVFCGLIAAVCTLGAQGLKLRHGVGVRIRLASDALSPVVLRSLLSGIVIAIPWAGVAIWQSAQGSVFSLRFEPSAAAALAMLRPGIMEEIIFRAFLPNLLLAVTGAGRPSGARLVAAFGLPTIFHALVHYDPLSAVTLSSGLLSAGLAGLIYGIPLAVLAHKRDLETAAAFHWFVNFAQAAVGL